MRIESYKDLEIDKYYFCRSKNFGTVEIFKVYGPEERKHIGPDKLWANKTNCRIFEKYDVIGPVEIPKFD